MVVERCIQEQGHKQHCMVVDNQQEQPIKKISRCSDRIFSNEFCELSLLT